MPRIARLVVPDAPHHITHRGINGRLVFSSDDDRALYLVLLDEECVRWGLDLLAYCLMSDHVHLIALPREHDSLSQAIGRAHWRYTQEFNRLHKNEGHLWQSRFDSAPIGAVHTQLVLRYVEQNPVRAGFCRRAWEYTWSSAAARCGWGRAGVGGLLDHPVWRETPDARNWSSAVVELLEAAELKHVRLATSRGRPIASENWIIDLENKVGGSLRARPVGRPRRN